MKLTVNAALLCTCDVFPISLFPYLEFYETSERKIRFLLNFFFWITVRSRGTKQWHKITVTITLSGNVYTAVFFVSSWTSHTEEKTIAICWRRANTIRRRLSIFCRLSLSRKHIATTDIRYMSEKAERNCCSWGCCQPTRWLGIGVRYWALAKWCWEGKMKNLEKILSQCHFIH
jgi:hypothetical protein